MFSHIFARYNMEFKDETQTFHTSLRYQQSNDIGPGQRLHMVSCVVSLAETQIAQMWWPEEK